MDNQKMPPGGDVGGSDLKVNAKATFKSGGYGASAADLKRGYTMPKQPEKHELPEARMERPKKGFVSRPIFSVER